MTQKLKVALISPTRMDPSQLNSALPGFTIFQAKNILEFQQAQGGRSVDAFLFLESPVLESEMVSYINFIRSKPAYAKTPIGFFSEKTLLSRAPFKDFRVRAYPTNHGLFLAIIEFLTNVQNPLQFENLITSESMTTRFSTALGHKIGEKTKFTAKVASFEETKNPFIAQKTAEISTNLAWLKLSVRILDQGAESIQKLFQGMSESEIESTSEKILELVIQDFKQDVETDLSTSGAISFPSIEQMQNQDKLPYLKGSKSAAVMFQSDLCSILLDINRYI